MISSTKGLDPTPKRRRGDPEWGKLKLRSALPTEFEIEVVRLGLTREQYVASAALRRWSDHNRNRVYIPEWLLDKWDMSVGMKKIGCLLPVDDADD